MKIYKLLPAVFIAVLVLFIIACNKNKEYDVVTPPEQAHFRNQSSGSYSITGPTVTYKVPVGITTVSNTDRTFNFSVVSNTGAIEGTHYTLDKKTVTILAGKVLDSIEVRGIQTQYLAGRKDTLKFFFTDASKKYSYNDTFKLLVRGPCFEGDVDLNTLRGTYAKTNELFGTSAYGPYVTTISAVNKLTATTGTITVTNIWDNGWGPLTFLLDWTNPAVRTATVISQTAISGSNAGDLNAMYAGQTIAVQPFAGQPGTFSVCNNTLTLKMQLGVTSLGFFNVLYQVTMAK